MQVHLIFLFLSLTCILFFSTWSPGGEWALSPLRNNLLLKFELVPIHEWSVYFPRPSHLSIPFKFGRGLAQVLDSIALAHCKVDARYAPFTSSYNLSSFLDMIIHAHAICTYEYDSYHTLIILAWMISIYIT